MVERIDKIYTHLCYNVQQKRTQYDAISHIKSIRIYFRRSTYLQKRQKDSLLLVEILLLRWHGLIWFTLLLRDTVGTTIAINTYQ